MDSLKQMKPVLGKRQTTVYNVIKTIGPVSNRQIASNLGWDINRVTGRVSELVSKGKVVSETTMYDNETKRTVRLWS